MPILPGQPVHLVLRGETMTTTSYSPKFAFAVSGDGHVIHLRASGSLRFCEKIPAAQRLLCRYARNYPGRVTFGPGRVTCLVCMSSTIATDCQQGVP